jgi:eukaryotic-like serine/threonine-protein kinase
MSDATLENPIADATLLCEKSEAITGTDESSPAAVLTSDLPAGLGEILGGYKLDEVIGRGGMATVYKGTHTVLGRSAAIKVLAERLASQSDQVSRFFQEARIVNDVQHPNIVQIYDFVYTETPPRVAFIMEVLSGQALSDHIQNRAQFTPIQAVNICFQICDALAAVHASGVIHRDLKPDNIFLTEPLESDFSYVPSVKLLDFGIAKQANGQATHKTATGMTLGTPAYMAPEQISGQAPTAKSDLYALASLLYEMLTGHRLYNGEAQSIMRQKILEDTPSLDALPQSPLRYRFEALVRWGLTREPKHRPSATDFARGLLEIRPEIVDEIVSSSATFIDAKSLARTPAPPIFQQRLRAPSVASPALEPQPGPSDSEIFAATKTPPRKIWGAAAVAIVVLLLLTGLIFRSDNKPSSLDSSMQSIETGSAAQPQNRGRRIDPVVIKTKPSGADIYDEKSGGHIGITPFAITLHPGETKWVRLAKTGFRTKKFQFAFGQTPTTVRLSKKRPRARRITREQAPAKAPKPAVPSPAPQEEDEGLLRKKELPSWN